MGGKIRLFLLTVLMVTGLARASTELEEWQTTNLNFRWLASGYLNDRRCLSAPEIFIGCVEALDSLANFDQDQPLRLVSRAHAMKAAEVLFQAGDLILIKDQSLSDTDQPWYELEAVFRQQRRAWLDQWDQVYRERSRFKLPFNQVFAHVAAGVDRKYEAMAAGYAFNEMLKNEYDPHTYVAPVIRFVNEHRSGGKELVGIGVTFEFSEQGIIVLKTVKKGPADKAGLKPYDVIIAVDGASARGDSVLDASKKISGEEGTTVRLTVQRGDKVLEIPVQRRKVTFPNLESEIITARSGHRVGYISLRAFAGRKTCKDFTSTVKSFNKRGKVAGLVVDLRGNGGGSLDIVACMLDAFLDDRRLIISTRDPITNEIIDGVITKDRRVHYNGPLVVLMDWQSASASEIFAGVVQDYGLGYVVGSRSFGKGTEQMVTLFHEVPGVAIARTVGRFHLPSGRTNQLVGIEPDFEAYAHPIPTPEDLYASREEDRYRNPILTAQTERTQYPPQLPRVRACVESQGVNRGAYVEGDDHVLLVAQDVVACANQERTLSKTRHP